MTAKTRSTSTAKNPLRAVIAAALAALAIGAVGCTDELVEVWELDHDRIVAIRATPPGILPGERAELDALLTAKGGRTSVRAPEAAIVVSPASLAGALALEDGKWIVTAPDAAALEAARAELSLEPGAPVPLVVGVSYANQTLTGTKTVRLGTAASNPSLDAMMIDGAPADTRPNLVIGKLVDVPLSIESQEEDFVNWLTSCGTLRDYDLPEAFLKVEEDDPTEGELAVVRRDPDGGVAWRVWPIRAE